ncbi:unnamed protein product [Nezara viridula]|uniref:Uncharacterized protein n=1 Tax=Nezara viridula TaxID=85310 RepID=A0A9P0MV36_NEZVI|nr:unnamed protein product [Nezara viridula]
MTRKSLSRLHHSDDTIRIPYLANRKGSVWREENPGKGERYWDEVFRLEVEDLKDIDDYGLLLCTGRVPKSQIRVFQSSRKSEGRSLLARDEMDFRRWLARSSRGEIVLLARKSFLSSSDFLS